MWLTSGVTSDDADTDASNNTVFETTTITATGRDLVVTNTNDSGPGSLREAIRHWPPPEIADPHDGKGVDA